MSFREIVYGLLVPAVDSVVVPFLYAIAFITFLWGIYQLFFSLDESKRKKGRDFAIWGIIGFVVMFSVWGLVRLLLSVLSGNA